jgi:hypothetical protein
MMNLRSKVGVGGVSKMKRSLRRHHLQRLKKKAGNYFGGWIKSHPDKAHFVGIYANTHTPCSCWMCGNPRKYFNEKTLQELKTEQAVSSTPLRVRVM